jgi:hypothetical protein
MYWKIPFPPGVEVSANVIGGKKYEKVEEKKGKCAGKMRKSTEEIREIEVKRLK